MTRSRAADDFAAIRARLEELRRENAHAAASERNADAPLSERERRQKERREGSPPPWVPTVFVKPSGSRR